MAKKQLTPEEKATKKREDSLRAAAWYAANRERARESHRQYREAHREELQEKKRAYCAAHAEEDRARVKAWREAHPEQAREATKAWIRKHPEQRRNAQAAWNGTHRDQLNAASRARYAKKRATNPMLVLIDAARERARSRGFCFDGLKEIAAAIPTTCGCCGLPFDYSSRKLRRGDRSASLDRFDPAKGYTVDNVRVICWRCNRLKSDATVQELEAIVAYMKGSHYDFL